MLRAVELFVGAGGLGLGISEASFSHEAVVEWDRDACETIASNQRNGVELVADWNVHNEDVTKFDYGSIKPDLDLLAGGPPCQPFSIGGKHRGKDDGRNMFPEIFRAARELKPKVILIENVKGLTRRSFAEFFGYIILQTTYPEVTRKAGESWTHHHSRLEQHHTKGIYKGLNYRVVYRLLNAAKYGVPQKRERVFIVAFRSDLNIEWSFPDETHSLDALLYQQWVSGEYWERHKVSIRARPQLPARFSTKIAELKSSPPKAAPCATVRDALQGLPDPRVDSSATRYANHFFVPGAKSYPGHTGSPLDEPAKTLKAGVHGVPGGENMLAYNDGSVRYFTVRETARLQTFPDNYIFRGAWSEAMRQLGNAVPVKLASFVAQNIREKLEERATRCVS